MLTDIDFSLQDLFLVFFTSDDICNININKGMANLQKRNFSNRIKEVSISIYRHLLTHLF